MRIINLCKNQNELAVIRRTESIEKATQLMANMHVGDVVVVKEHQGELQPLGILTDRDIILRILSRKIDPKTLNAGDVMSPNIITTEENDDIENVIHKMNQHGVKRIAVIDNKGSLKGIVSSNDILEHITKEIISLVKLTRAQHAKENQETLDNKKVVNA